MQFIRELSLDFRRVVESAALAAAKTMGQGKRRFSDLQATQALRKELETLDINGTVVIGEGERDEAPTLYIGERVGKEDPHKEFPQVDLAVDPLEGTSLCAFGMEGAISALAASKKGGLLNAPDIYMNKIIVEASCKNKVDINAPVEENLKNIADGLNRDVEDLVIVVLDRDRHRDLVRRIRKAGARIRLISDGDLSGGISVALRGTGIHAVMGIGGAPEGVLTAAALKCINGDMQAKLHPHKPGDEKRIEKMGLTGGFDKVYGVDDLAPGNSIIFAATGVTNGGLLKGVQFFGGGYRAHSVVMTHTTVEKTIKFVENVVLDTQECIPIRAF